MSSDMSSVPGGNANNRRVSALTTRHFTTHLTTYNLAELAHNF